MSFFSSHVQTGVPRIVETGSDLLENLWNSLIPVASAGCFVYCARRDTSQGDFPALSRQDTRATLYWGALWGNRSHSAPSFHCRILQEGTQSPHRSTPLTRIACQPCPSRTGEPHGRLFPVWKLGCLYITSSTEDISLSQHPPTQTSGVVLGLVPRIWKKTKKETDLGGFHQSPPAITVQSLSFLCLSHQEVLEKNISCDLFLELGSVRGLLAHSESVKWHFASRTTVSSKAQAPAHHAAAPFHVGIH